MRRFYSIVKNVQSQAALSVPVSLWGDSQMGSNGGEAKWFAVPVGVGIAAFSAIILLNMLFQFLQWTAWFVVGVIAAVIAAVLVGVLATLYYQKKEAALQFMADQTWLSDPRRNAHEIQAQIDRLNREIADIMQQRKDVLPFVRPFHNARFRALNQTHALYVGALNTRNAKNIKSRSRPIAVAQEKSNGNGQSMQAAEELLAQQFKTRQFDITNGLPDDQLPLEKQERVRKLRNAYEDNIRILYEGRRRAE